MNQYGVGDYFYPVLALGMILWGIVLLIRADKIEAARDAAEQPGDYEPGGGYDSRKMRADPRTIGWALIAMGIVITLNSGLRIWSALF